MKCSTYNIHYGIGLDGAFDLERIVDAVAGSDLIALQEVGRGIPDNGGVDMIDALRSLFPDRFVGEGCSADAHLSSEIENGRLIEHRFQFGNMIVSRWPLLFVRNHLLPRQRNDGQINLQRGALEALIQTPLGPLRFFSVHLDHLDVNERLLQIAAIRDIVQTYKLVGGAVTGISEWGFEEMPLASGVVVAGDFNMDPGSPEYHAMLGDAQFPLVDITTSDPSYSFHDPRADIPKQRLDYMFADSNTAERLDVCSIDGEAVGSDHLPVHVTLK